MGDIIPVAEDVEEFIKRGNESEQIALENLKTIAPVIKKQMTKHDIREKEGKKIWELIKQHYTPTCTACFEEEKECFVCAADAVCDYMISKIEEARKETVKEILKEFWGLKWGQSELDNVCIRLADKFHIEMEA